MKKIHIISIFLVGLFFSACEPTEIEKVTLDAAPAVEQLSFTIEPGADDYHFIIKNTSSVKGIANWDLGNGTKVSGDEVTAYYPLPGTYTVKLSLYTNGGSAETTKTQEQTETDASIFTDPMFAMVSGGVDDVDGKTWVVDSLSAQHFGVGPVDGTWPEWWPADPLAKSGAGAYDDELTFIMTDFVLNYDNKGQSFVKTGLENTTGYANARPGPGGDDFIVDYTPMPGTWFIEEKDGAKYLKMSGSTPLFPGFDLNPTDGLYRIDAISENEIKLSCISNVDNNRWYYILIPKGYERPSITFDLDASEGADNLYTMSLTNFSIPDGQSVADVTWDFGDGSAAYTTSDKDEVVTHTYMRKGSYLVTATVATSIGDIVKTYNAAPANHNSAYEEYILDAMVMYNDFGEQTPFDVLGENCSVTVVDNPDNSMYPNRSNNVAFYTKTDQAWANANMMLPTGYRFDLRQQSTFKILVYGKKDDVVLLKLENTDRGGNAWQTGTELTYTIQEDNTWEIAEYNFAGVGAGWNWTGDIYTSDVTTDDNFSHDFYNIIRIMLNANEDAGGNVGTHEFYFDALEGPHIEGLK